MLCKYSNLQSIYVLNQFFKFRTIYIAKTLFPFFHKLYFTIYYTILVLTCIEKYKDILK